MVQNRCLIAHRPMRKEEGGRITHGWGPPGLGRVKGSSSGEKETKKKYAYCTSTLLPQPRTHSETYPPYRAYARIREHGNARWHCPVALLRVVGTTRRDKVRSSISHSVGSVRSADSAMPSLRRQVSTSRQGFQCIRYAMPPLPFMLCDTTKRFSTRLRQAHNYAAYL